MSIEILALLEPIPTSLTLAKRFGSTNDGGYVLINDFSKKDFLLSMGVGNDVSFEKSISEHVGEMHLYDDSINALPENLLNSTFYRERVGDIGFVTISDAVQRAKNSNDFILKMDIEGSEWDAIQAESSEILKLFRQIIVEFHWFGDFNDNDYLSKTLGVLNKLAQTHFIMNAHPNNNGELLYIDGVIFPQVIEVTYLRRNDYEIIFSHVSYKKDLFEFNSPCNPKEPEIHVNQFGLYIDSHNVGAKALISTLKEIHELTQQRDELTQQRDELTQQRDEFLNSTIWRLTKPLRDLINFLKKKF
jgi:hypothetical protein